MAKPAHHPPAPKRPPKRVEKTGKKTAGAFRKGADSRRGRGPKKGAPNAGRPRNEHIAWCQQMVSDSKAEMAVHAVLKDPAHPAFATMWKAVTDRAYGKPSQSMELTGPNGAPLPPTQVTVQLVRPV